MLLKLLLDTELSLVGLDGLLLELDRSSMLRICSRFTWSLAGPGNCKLPVLNPS
jgi:hypothetical protein